MPTFVTFSHGLPINAIAMVLRVFGPGNTVAGLLLGSPGENVAKLGTILHYLANPFVDFQIQDSISNDKQRHVASYWE